MSSDQEERLTPKHKSWRDWISENPIAAVTLVGLLFYGSLRLSTGLFYGRLGFQPEEVGLGYAQLLARSAYTLALFVIFGVIISFALFAMNRRKRRDGEPVPTLRKIIVGLLDQVRWQIVLNVLFLALVVAPVILALVSANRAVNGQPVPGAFLTLPWTAQAAEVRFIGSDAPIEDGCFLYLGQSDGFAAIFDPATPSSSWRIPVGSVSIRTRGDLDDVEHVPGDCPSDQ